MRIKSGVKLAGVRPEIVIAMHVVDSVMGGKLVITSVVDGVHGVNSLHYVGLAFDMRTRDTADVNKLAKDIRNALGSEYDVVVEKTHIHIEFQP